LKLKKAMDDVERELKLMERNDINAPGWGGTGVTNRLMGSGADGDFLSNNKNSLVTANANAAARGKKFGGGGSKKGAANLLGGFDGGGGASAAAGKEQSSLKSRAKDDGI
jgi:hypothetical protein